MEHYVFPSYLPYAHNRSHFLWAIITTAAIFFSVLIHEFAHILAEKVFGLPIKSRIIFPYGGVISNTNEICINDTLISVSLTGPIANMILSSLFHLLNLSAIQNQWAIQIIIICQYLTYANIIITGINILPLPPFDGGVVLKAILYLSETKFNIQLAHSINLTVLFITILLSIVLILNGFILSGIWLIIIALTIMEGLQCSNTGHSLKHFFKEAKAENYMRQNPITVKEEISLKQFITQYMYRYHMGIFPVIKNKQPMGFMLTSSIKTISKQKWDNYTISELMIHCQETNVINRSTNLLDVIKKMHTHSTSRLVGIDTGESVSVITLKDLLYHLAAKLNLQKNDL